MTLPTQINFPNDGKPADIIRILEDMYQSIVQNVNGFITEWTPKLVGLTTPGDGTYTHQSGWILRQGIIVDCWFDIEWSAHTGTGNAYIELPYKVKLTNNSPFVGPVFMSNITLGAGYTSLFMLGQSNTFRGLIYGEGSGLPVANLAIIASGRLFGHFRYIGQEFE